ncbi:MAG: mevalonate kinase [Methanomassiliicoccales archaeon]
MKASAPGKVILFGEHAVVFGKPAIAAAIDMRIEVDCTPSSITLFNGLPVAQTNTPHAYHALRLSGKSGAEISVRSDIPAGAGLGSSAALAAALTASLNPEMKESEIASTAYKIELLSQKRASPLDTSAVVHGHAIYVSAGGREGTLWSVGNEEVRWEVSHLDIRALPIVIGYTGVPAATGPLVLRVRKMWERFPTVRLAIEEIGTITEEAVKLLPTGDLTALGRLMERNQKLLSVIGVGSPVVDKLLDAVRPLCYGAKLTGAGGGGSIIALTDKQEKVMEAIRQKGGIPYSCSLGAEGIRRVHEVRHTD